MKSARLVVTLVFLVVTSVILFFLILGLENLVLSTDMQAMRVHLWIQYLTGSWPRDWDTIIHDRKSIEFSLLLTVRTLMTLGPVVAIAKIFWDISKLGEIMRYMDLIKLRDSLIYREMINQEHPDRREELKGKLQRAFSKADSDLYDEQLTIIMPEQLAKIREQLFRNIG
jgi:hypothetical protein